MTTDLLELVVELTEALDAAQVELALLAEERMPLPDRLVKQLEERDALAATLRRVKAALPHRAEHLKAVYREELSKVVRTDDTPPAPVSPEVGEQVAAAMEILRRRALVNADLGHALDGALLRSTFAGC